MSVTVLQTIGTHCQILPTIATLPLSKNLKHLEGSMNNDQVARRDGLMKSWRNSVVKYCQPLYLHSHDVDTRSKKLVSPNWPFKILHNW